MEMPKWGEPFRLDTLYDGWDKAPRKAGVYAVYTGKAINRAGGPDMDENWDVGSNTTLHFKRKDLTRCSLSRISVQTEIDIVEWEE